MTKGILILPGTPRRTRKNNVQFSASVLLIGKDEMVNLQAPASTNEELSFDYNPPTAVKSQTGGRQGTMRVKAPGVNKKGGRASLMNLYGPPADVKEKEPTIIEGNLKLLKESGNKSTWQKRYITLTNTHISYFRTKEKADKPLKSFEITADCYVKEISSRTGVADCRCSLEVFYDRKKSIVLKGTTPRESTEWITSICTVIDTMSGDREEEEFDFVDESDEGSMEFFEEDNIEVPTINRSALEEIPFGGNPLEEEEPAEFSDSFEWVDEEVPGDNDEAMKVKELARKEEEQKETKLREEETRKKREKEREDLERKKKEEKERKEKEEKERRTKEEQQRKPKQSIAPAVQPTAHTVRPGRKLSKIEALMKRFEA